MSLYSCTIFEGNLHLLGTCLQIHKNIWHHHCLQAQCLTLCGLDHSMSLVPYNRPQLWTCWCQEWVRMWGVLEQGVTMIPTTLLPAPSPVMMTRVQMVSSVASSPVSSPAVPRARSAPRDSVNEWVNDSHLRIKLIIEVNGQSRVKILFFWTIFLHLYFYKFL